MAELSDAFVMLPGGFGAFEEFMEAVTWRELAIHEKPSRILNVDRYFADLLAFVTHAVEMGFIWPHNAAQIAVSDALGSMRWLPNHSCHARVRVSSTPPGVGVGNGSVSAPVVSHQI